MRILLIEDDKDYAETLIDIFSENQNYDILWVEKLEATEQAIKNKKWDIILSDVHLSFHPEKILKLNKKSSFNYETPLIFLTAERDTKLASDLIEKGDFPVISKFEIDEDILSVVQNYSDLYNLIKRQESGEQVSFRKFIARYINEKRYESSEFSSTLSGWIDQEKLLFSKLKAKSSVTKSKKENNFYPSFRAGYLKINRSDFKIIEFSPGIESLADDVELKGLPLCNVLNKIVDAEKLYEFLYHFLEYEKVERTDITLPSTGFKGTIHYDIFIKKSDIDDEKCKTFEIEVIQNRELEVEKAELFNLRETNKLLLQEVHHRVNNNLNAITSLLNLRLMDAEEKVAEVYQTVLEQIAPIAVVYEQLYTTKKIASVNIKDYLKRLNRKVFSNTNYSAITSKIDVEDEKLYLDLNQVISLGLLLNEIYQKHKERDVNFELSVSKQFDVITLAFNAENISSILDEQNSLTGQKDNFIFNALLNKLGALISVSKKDKILIRFKKVTKRGSASNLRD